ncbi:MAG: RHS repeat-associated core domain-containing protein [Paludibacteraceae bacterium]|nr:RHS repeat-associated core domain-containing protein [Paludibacteraceae bacterium]
MPGGWLLSRSTSYIPYGEVFVEESSAGWQSPYYFNSKELDEETGLYYYGARYLNPTEARWLSVDPMWEKYVGMSPYNYCAGNPVMLVDPDGRSINGVDEGDLNSFKSDVSIILKDEKFEDFKNLLVVNTKKNKFDKIDVSKKEEALNGKNLSNDEKTFIDCLTNAINSEDKHYVSYYSKSVSKNIKRSLVSQIAKEHSNLAYSMRDSEDPLLALGKYVDQYDNAITFSAKEGTSTSIIKRDGVDEVKTAIRSMHEVLGHGVAFTYKNDRRSSTNNSNAVRMENLVRRILNLNAWDGKGHQGFDSTEISNPYSNPLK